jgi:arylsulfatase A-like enzyme
MVMAQEKPNILLIVLDALRPDHLSTYGYHRETSPCLSELAGGGCVFRQAIATSIWTLPTFASLFSGAHTPGHNTHARNLVLPDRIITLAEILSQQGYTTVGLSNTPLVSAATNLDRGFSHFSLGGRFNSPIKGRLNPFQNFISKRYRRFFKSRYGKGTPWAVKEVKKWAGRLKEEHVPFFIFAHFVETHLPYHPPAQYRQRFLSDSVLLKEAERLDQNPSKYFTGKVPWGEREFELLRCLYDAEINYLDHCLGEIFACLREMGVLDQTLIIITADHGENLGEHQLMDHQYCVYDTLLRIPLIIRYPGIWEKGKESTDLVQTIDIVPTICDLLNLKKDDFAGQVQGISLLSPEKRDVAVSEYWYPWLRPFKKYPDFDTSRFEISYTAIRKGEHKLIRTSDGRVELYHLKDDPGEGNNLIEKAPEKVKELEVLLDRWLKDNHLPTLPGKTEEGFDQDIKEQLEGLGYL